MINLNNYATFDDVLFVPQWSSINSRLNVSTETYFTKNIKLKIPFVSSNMDTVCGAEMCNAIDFIGGIGILHRNWNSMQEWFEEINKITAFNYGISVGVQNWKQILEKIELHNITHCDQLCYPQVVVIDVANAANQKVYNEVKALVDHRDRLRKSNVQPIRNWQFDIMVGNIATAEAAKKYKLLEIEGLKVGIGPGAACETRNITGVGVPQLHALDEISNVLQNSNIKICADGGITKPADANKALAAGASSVMIGQLFSYAQEAAWKWEWNQDNKNYEKIYRGMASFSPNRTKEGISHKLMWNPRTQGELPTIKEIVETFTGGLQSCCSYNNAQNINQLQENAQFINVSPATYIENQTRIHLPILNR